MPCWLLHCLVSCSSDLLLSSVLLWRQKKIWWRKKKYYSLSSRSSSYMDLCVCRKKYCWELTILCLCIWSTSNDWRLDLQLELSEVTPIFMEIHHIALCSLSSSIDRGIWLRKNLGLYSRCCLVCAWNRWGGTNRHL